MRKFLPFVFGVLIGTVVAIAWTNFSTKSSAMTPAAASISPLEMMTNTGPLPSQSPADMF
jgi:hypothetical protein